MHTGKTGYIVTDVEFPTGVDTERYQDLYKIITRDKNYKNRYLKHSFRIIKSKKNTVAYALLDGKPRIVKWFAPGFKRQMEIESTLLKNGTSFQYMPILCEKDIDNNVLIMNYILGENLCDVINEGKTFFNEKKRIMILLAEWFAQFHKYFKKADKFRIRGDSILRNFILNDRIWGVDFEESRHGKPTEDVACICSSILSTAPLFTHEKFQLCEIFISSYSEMVNWKLEYINREIAYSLLEKIQWRKEEEERLRKYANKIRKHGLLCFK